ncbi:MAG TPA: polysaccharide biosynthesis/export family protein [Terracidiphilus sp.]|jgi:polysaccharide export outer membrane protein
MVSPEDRTSHRSTLNDANRRQNTFVSLLELWILVRRDARVFLAIVGSFLFACLVYCLVAPPLYEATARVALRSTPLSDLAIERNESATSGSFASGQVQLETLANVFRSDELAWKVITEWKLYQAPGMTGSFKRRFPGFNAEQPPPDARAYLLDEFQRDLTVQSIPRTLVLQIRFRSHDAALSTAVVNSLIQAYGKQQVEERVQATNASATWLNGQLGALKVQVDRENQQLADFQKKHGILNTPETLGNGQPTEIDHTAELTEVDAISRELVSASTDRILMEAEYHAAASGDPEMVLASDPKLQAAGGFASALLIQLRARRSELEQEQTQLRIEHGPNFPRVVEIRNQMQDLDLQIKTEDTKLVQRFRGAWQTALDREQLLRSQLADATGAGMKLNEAALQYAVMRQEANASRDVYIRVMQQTEEAGLAAASHSTDVSVIDFARQPVKPASPDLLVNMAITLFVSLWIAVAAVLMRKSIRSVAKAAVLALVFAMAHAAIHPQAPTPSTSGLPTGVARIPQSSETRGKPNVKEAPPVWNSPQGAPEFGVPAGVAQPMMPMAAPIGAGDLLEVSEARTPEMRASVRVSATGMVTLALAGEVRVAGMDESSAAHAIEAALIDRGMLLRPQVIVLVTAYAAQDVTVLGEVTRPGVYAYAVHHRLLDMISTASGLNANAGRLVFVTHRDSANAGQTVVLDPSGIDAGAEHNPELMPGDTVKVSRAGLVYVVGDVIRPGGFPVDQVQTTTVVQVLSLAWGPAQNASLTKAILIREQPGGRTVTSLNLKRMLRGQDPDIPIPRSRYIVCARLDSQEFMEPDHGVRDPVGGRGQHLRGHGLLATILSKCEKPPNPCCCCLPSQFRGSTRLTWVLHGATSRELPGWSC